MSIDVQRLKTKGYIIQYGITPKKIATRTDAHAES